MKTAIIGAGRNKNGIGQYIGKYLQKNGANVVSVLGTNVESVQKASSHLSHYGINATNYIDFHRMVKRERPDAIVIASPALTHYEYLMKCVDEGVHVFCEKPFFWQQEENIDIQTLLENIFEKAVSKDLKIAMNSQWPFSLPHYEELCGSINIRQVDTFFISMSPMVSGKEMIVESVPHALSILYSVFGDGKINNLNIEAHEDKIMLKFHYISAVRNCEVLIDLARKMLQPRSFSYGFNNKIIHRKIDLDRYDIFFNYSNRNLKINDPLELSVQDFISAVKGKRDPLIGKTHIVNNMNLLKKIYDGCEVM